MPDPALALETYAHEWRHSYQNAMAHELQTGFRQLAPDRQKAELWAKDFEHYTRAETDFEAYRKQQIESDSRDFATRLAQKVMGRTSHG